MSFQEVIWCARSDSNTRPTGSKPVSSGNGLHFTDIAARKINDLTASVLAAYSPFKAKVRTMIRTVAGFPAAALMTSVQPIRPIAVSGRPAVRSGAEYCRLRNAVLNGGQPGQPDAHGSDAGGNPTQQGAPAVRVEASRFAAHVTLDATGGTVSLTPASPPFRFTSRAQLEAWLRLNTSPEVSR